MYSIVYARSDRKRDEAQKGKITQETISKILSNAVPSYQSVGYVTSGMPLGGLGTGSIEMRPDGCFHEWQICNNEDWSGEKRAKIAKAHNQSFPAPVMNAEDAFFAIRTKNSDDDTIVRLLHHADRRGWVDGDVSKASQSTMYKYPWLRQVRSIQYRGFFPFLTSVTKTRHCPCR